MKKKMMGIVLVVMTIVASMAMQGGLAYATEKPSLVASADCEQVKCNETFVVDVTLSGKINPASGQARLLYDQNKLDVVEVTKGDILTDTNVAMSGVNTTTKGVIYATFLYNVDKVAEAGILFSVEFKVRNNVSTGKLNFTFAETEFNQVDFETIDVAIVNEEVEIIASSGKWIQDGTGWWYQNADGSYPYNSWQAIGGSNYYFNNSGYIVTGWQNIGGIWYYMNASGAMVTGWQSIGGTWYYFNESGAMVTGWQSIGGTWYYFNGSGAMVTDWQAIGGTWYYFNGSGAMVTDWQAIGGTWYYFSGSGAMVTGWQSIGGTWYYFSGSGAMVTGWQSIGGTWYYFNGSGAMVTGWQSIGGTWYYFNESGAMITGWQAIGGTWYYFNGSGAMAAGQWIGNYYLNADGSMATNQWIGSYYVGADGAWIPGMTR